MFGINKTPADQPTKQPTNQPTALKAICLVLRDVMSRSRPSLALLLAIWRHGKLLCLLLAFLLFFCETVHANPDAKRLYDDLLSNYNRLIRPVSNNTDTVLVKLGLRLSQLIDLVSQMA